MCKFAILKRLNKSNFIKNDLIMKTTTNKTDLVKKMRKIRDKFNKEIINMTWEQEKEFIKNQLTELKSKKQN